MTRVALKGLAGRKVRSVLTALAIVLGVAMVSGTYVLTDTISKAFDDIFSGSYSQTSAVISGRQVVEGSSSGNPTVPESLVTRVRQAPGVAAAAGVLSDETGTGDSVKVLGSDGKPLSNGGAPTLGFGVDASQPRFNPLHLTAGRWAAGGRQVVLDAATAKSEHLAVGQTVRLVAQGPARTFTISGIAKYGTVDSLGGATIAVFDIPTAQAVLHKPGQLDEISVAAKAGVSDAALVADLRPLLPPTARVQTASDRAAANSKDTKDVLHYLQYALLAFGVIALFVGAFVIFNTLSITVAQRSREFATLRTLGASRRQILRSVLLEALALGVLASLVGLGLGVALAKGLSAVMKAFSLDLPQAGTVFATRTVVVSLVLGILITVLASLAPALRATRVPPIAAVREGSALPPSRMGRHQGSGAVVLTGAALAMVIVGSLVSGLSTGVALALIAVGCLALFVGIALVAPRLVRPLASVLGMPARRFGGTPGRLAQDNSTRNPGRTATTAAALMIGLALVTLVATIGQGIRSSDRQALENQVRADYVITSQNGFDGFSADTAGKLPAIPGVGVASAVLADKAKVFGQDVSLNGVDPATATQTLHFPWAHGSDAAVRDLGADGAIVKKDYADKHHLQVGTAFVATTPTGQPLSLRVAAISDPPVFDKVDSVLGDITISRQAFAQGFPRGKASLILLKVAGGASAQTTATLKKALGGFPDTKLETKAAWVTTRSEGINTLLNMLYVLLALSVVVSLFGMVNTLVLAVFERTRELGMLRAVGMTRSQTRRMIRYESVITALIGAALGLPIGLGLAAVFTHALADQGLAFSLPLSSLVVFAIVAVLAGIGAAIVPARRAARLNVLRALQYE
jgi:putative ABC transport system permease protein